MSCSSFSLEEMTWQFYLIQLLAKWRLVFLYVGLSRRWQWNLMWNSFLVELGGNDGKNYELTVLRMNFQLVPSCSAYDTLARQRQSENVDSHGRYDDVDFHQMCRGIWECVDLSFRQL